MKKIFSFLLLSILLFSNTALFNNEANAFSLSARKVNIRVFKAPKTWYLKMSSTLKNNPNTKNFTFVLDANPLSLKRFSYKTLYFLKLKDEYWRNPSSFLAKDLTSSNRDGSVFLGKTIKALDKITYRKNKEKNIREYSITFPYSYLNDWINYFITCALDTWFWSADRNLLRCADTKTVYFDKKNDKVVSKETVNNLYKEYKSNQLKKINYFINKTNSYFDENKIKKSKYKNNSRIKTHQELQKSILSKLKTGELNEIKKEVEDQRYQENREKENIINKSSRTIAGHVLKEDDNYAVLNQTIPQFSLYVKGVILKYINGEINLNGETLKNAQENKKKVEQVKNNELNNNTTNNNDEISKLKRDNEINRKKAIDLSKKILIVLKRYKTKQEKLRQMDNLFKLLDTKYTPDRFPNQDLIKYVRDYLGIVRFAIEVN